MINKKRNARDGFTIVEIFVVLTVFSISVVAVSSLLYAIQSTQRNAQYLSIATHAARAEVERLRSSGYDSIDSGSTYPFGQLPATLPDGSTGSVVVSTPASSSLSKQVDATVTYSIDGNAKQVTITAYIDPPKV